jgi:hypothetical protein
LCGPYITFVIASLTSASTLGGNESLVAGIVECTNPNLPPASSLEFVWQIQNPPHPDIDFTDIHIATIVPDWKLNSEGKNDAMFALAVPNSNLQIVRGMNYTFAALAYWNSGPLKSPDSSAGAASIGLTAQ